MDAATVSTKDELLQTAMQVAHDIQSPLAALDMALSAFSLNGVPDQGRAIILGSVQRIREIASDLLQMSRTLNTTKQQCRGPKPFSIAPVIDAIVSEKRLGVKGKRGLSIQSQISTLAFDTQVVANKSDVMRVLSNLVDNSIDALGAKGNIRVVASLEDSFAVVSVLDNGSGIPREMLRKLREGVSFSSKESGFGLGLKHARKSVEKWGGKIKIESREREFTCVSVYVPVAVN